MAYNYIYINQTTNKQATLRYDLYITFYGYTPIHSPFPRTLTWVTSLGASLRDKGVRWKLIASLSSFPILSFHQICVYRRTKVFVTAEI